MGLTGVLDGLEVFLGALHHQGGQVLQRDEEVVGGILVRQQREQEDGLFQLIGDVVCDLEQFGNRLGVLPPLAGRPAL